MKWANDIEEWTAKPFSEIRALAHDRQRRRGLVDSAHDKDATTVLVGLFSSGHFVGSRLHMAV